MEGWISLYRKFLEWEWYSDTNTKVVFLHCLLKANNQKKAWRGIEIQRSEFFTSLNHLSKELNLTIKQTRIALAKLEKTGEIITRGASNGTMITVCNYDSYQNNETEKGKRKGKHEASKGPAVGKQGATTNKDNKENNDNKETSIYRSFSHLVLTIEEFKNLIESGFTKSQIDETLDNIENYKQNRKYTSLYLTAKNWLKKDSQKKPDDKFRNDNIPEFTDKAY
ncbi:MAG: hypothetical protein AB7E36_14905 [Salinivirgaceae bacterium]